MFNRTYLQQVALIQSQCQPRKKQPMISTYAKSPLRDRENRINLGNTPGRNGPKASLSPLRSRRTESSVASRVCLSRKRMQPTCINEPNKVAKYVAYSQQQTLYYCQKCAILLASQGFAVTKLSSAGESFEVNPRKQEIDSFLADLEVVMTTLGKKQQTLTMSISNASKTYHEEEANVKQYYGQFYQIIDQHKRRVLEELKEEYDSGVKGTVEVKDKVQSAIADSKHMKEDIFNSINIILQQTDEEQFRPIMNNYLSNLRDYRALGNKNLPEAVAMRRLDFKDPQAACNALEQGLQITWQDKNESEMGYSKQSDCPQNPVQVIQAEDKFTKSSLKQIGNLFSSFDE